jgi:hypothetical protein
MGGKDITELTFRRMTRLDVMQVGPGSDFKQIGKYVARLSDVPLSVIDQMAIADFHAACAMIKSMGIPNGR